MYEYTNLRVKINILLDTTYRTTLTNKLLYGADLQPPPLCALCFCRLPLVRVYEWRVERKMLLDTTYRTTLTNKLLYEADLQPLPLCALSFCRVPLVKSHLADLLGRDKTAINFGLSCTMNADESIARGCALQCAMLSSR